MPKVFQYLFLFVSAIEIVAEISGNNLLRFIFKPLLMPALIMFYVSAIGGLWNRFHKQITAAFFFSWIGDVALMFVFKNENFFLVGLVGFLIAHILYAVSFSKVQDTEALPLLSEKRWVLIPLVIYMVVFLYLLVPAVNGSEKTQPFLIPVLIYSAAIAIMVAFSINRYKRVSDKSFMLVVSGALLFMFSDSIIAINKFLHPFPSAGIFIMVLYIAGQYLIAKGCLAQFNSKADS
ncbi:MAG: lysoplasmalogenase [Bacteroidota bacterium]